MNAGALGAALVRAIWEVGQTGLSRRALYDRADKTANWSDFTDLHCIVQVSYFREEVFDFDLARPGVALELPEPVLFRIEGEASCECSVELCPSCERWKSNADVTS